MVDYHFINTHLFSEAANNFKKNGAYTLAPRGTKDNDDFWDQEYDRIHNGYSVGGVKITGRHYFYLNYCPIRQVSLDTTGTRGADRKVDFPLFWDYDFAYFWSIEIARYGLSVEEYTKLNLPVRIREKDLEGGKHLVVLKARGKGYSYKGAAMLGQVYLFGEKAKAYAIAEDTAYLTEDGLLTKTNDILSHNNTFCMWGQPSLIDKEDHKKCGYKEKNSEGIWIDKGRLNEIIGISCKNNPQVTRGKRGDVLLFEEAGKFRGLDVAWNVSRPGVEQGKYTLGIQIAYGTGGTEGSDWEPLQKMYYNPDAYNCLGFHNIWDTGRENEVISFFVPANWNLDGFMDKDGNSDHIGATKFILDERDEIAQSKTDASSSLEQRTAEFPLTPKEAILSVDKNIFPSTAISKQIDRILAEDLASALVIGDLEPTRTGIKFIPNFNKKPIFSYPIGKEDRDGALWVLESPIRVNGEVPENLYIMAVDPYDKDGKTASVSLGSVYIYKRTSRISSRLNECIVAGFVGRPILQDTFNDMIFALAEYYNCKVSFEANRGNTLEYAKRKRLTHKLSEEPNILKGSNQDRKIMRYGITMTENVKRQGEIYIRDWLTTPIDYDMNDNARTPLHYIYDKGLLQELLAYNSVGNFDRVSALIVLMYYIKETYHREVEDVLKKNTDDFFNRDWRRD